ncbi:uncharacterized protein LOC120278457 [Dioscorea cayenensis subsp. rotundata]|uniref:Uncharacterized protein LOC120278457 n=1 Tax=Dioscorea cayennensis subsp. rotundata TaxID=55577 RepID=A0AB40CMK3_DIOCR|nr:uncharacterized protein LOC120278457 [Dioscorea cayenensis subsp. rotundata]
MKKSTHLSSKLDCIRSSHSASHAPLSGGHTSGYALARRCQRLGFQKSLNLLLLAFFLLSWKSLVGWRLERKLKGGVVLISLANCGLLTRPFKAHQVVDYLFQIRSKVLQSCPSRRVSSNHHSYSTPHSGRAADCRFAMPLGGTCRGGALTSISCVHFSFHI